MTTIRLRSVLLRWSLLLLAACDWNMMGPASCTGSVTVSPPAATIAVGSSVQLAATTRDTAGNVVYGYTVTWTSDAPRVASVDQSGLVQGVAAGQTKVWAAADGQSGSAAITVTPAR